MYQNYLDGEYFYLNKWDILKWFVYILMQIVILHKKKLVSACSQTYFHQNANAQCSVFMYIINVNKQHHTKVSKHKILTKFPLF